MHVNFVQRRPPLGQRVKHRPLDAEGGQTRSLVKRIRQRYGRPTEVQSHQTVLVRGANHKQLLFLLKKAQETDGVEATVQHPD